MSAVARWSYISSTLSRILPTCIDNGSFQWILSKNRRYGKVLDIGDSVDAAVADDENQVKKTTTTITAVFTLESSSITDPWMLFLYSLKAPAISPK
jgi:hypothetical protein